MAGRGAGEVTTFLSPFSPFGGGRPEREGPPEATGSELGLVPINRNKKASRLTTNASLLICY